MRYEFMRPHQISDAIKRNLPVVLPMGVLEYHGEHLGVGMDTLAVTRMFDLAEREIEMVILPPFWYGAASYAVEPPEGKGSVQVDSEVLAPFARSLFTGLLRIGFRNIHGFIHHQSENFAVGMPTDLAFKFGARQAIFAFLEKERGEGWWGREEMKDYYASQAAGGDPFNWIRFHPLMSPEVVKQYYFDHAGIGETALMLALAPEAADMSMLSEETWYTRGAGQATRELGERARDLILAGIKSALS